VWPTRAAASVPWSRTSAERLSRPSRSSRGPVRDGSGTSTVLAFTVIGIPLPLLIWLGVFVAIVLFHLVGVLHVGRGELPLPLEYHPAAIGPGAARTRRPNVRSSAAYGNRPLLQERSANQARPVRPSW
jgi:hypothetical protein